jgi:hypothetical protein
MIGNQTKGRGFRGLLNYLESQRDARLIGGNMGGYNARALAREFQISRQLNLKADRVVYHASLSLPPNERLDDETWNEIANRYLEQMGFDCNQYVVYRHADTSHDHIHICASRIRLDNGKIVHDSWDYKRSETIIRQIERDYGLQQTQSSYEKLSRNPSVGQQRRLEREHFEYINGLRPTPQERPIKQQLQELIDRATTDHPTMPQLIERLQLLGVEVRHGFTRNGKSKGISYSMDGQAFSGSQLGSAYTFPGLQKHKGVDYQPQRDSLSIEQLLLNPVKLTQINQQFLLSSQPETVKAFDTQLRSVQSHSVGQGIEDWVLGVEKEHSSLHDSAVNSSAQCVTVSSVGKEHSSLHPKPDALGFDSEPGDITPRVHDSLDESTIKPGSFSQVLPRNIPHPAEEVISLNATPSTEDENEKIQFERTQIVAPILAGILSVARTTRFEGKEHTVYWSENQLVLVRNSDQAQLIRARKKQSQWEPVERSSLTEEIVQHFQQFIPKIEEGLRYLQQEKEKSRENRSQGLSL